MATFSALRSNTVSGNLVARLLALGALTCSSLVVARMYGPAGVGALSLMRVLPWVVGVLCGFGLYGAAPFFLSGPARDDPAYRSTFPAIAVTAGVTGIAVWLLCLPLFRHSLFPELPLIAVAGAAANVLTQLVKTTAKCCSQGIGDLKGSNRIIVLEELLFLPAYGLLLAVGVSGYVAIVFGLALGDVMTATQGWIRLYRRRFFSGSRPSLRHARAIANYGFKSQLSSIALLMNARLDFTIVAAFIGPSALGVYAIASRYSELLRLPGLAMNYVLYPRYASAHPSDARRDTAGALRRMGLIPVLLALPMAIMAPFVLPFAYGAKFSGAVVPSWILLVGLSGCGITGIVMAFLFASGRPGLSSAAQGVGVAVTVLLDLTLIPRFGVSGAAVASALAYLITTAMLLFFFRRARDHVPVPSVPAGPTRYKPRHSKEIYT
jgi:O-antigen/teichoic acid export membrane protein